MPRLCPCKTQQGQQTHLGSSTRPDTTSRRTATPNQQTTYSHPPPRYQAGHNHPTMPTAPAQRRHRARRLTMGNWRVHQLRQRWTNQPRKHRRISSVYRIPRHLKQIPLLLPCKDMQRGHLSLPPPADPTILHQPWFQTPYPPERLLHDLSLSQSQPVL